MRIAVAPQKFGLNFFQQKRTLALLVGRKRKKNRRGGKTSSVTFV